MEIIICKTKEEASRKAADLVAALIKAKPKAVLGLATGSTPVPMYQYLAKDCAAGKITFKQVKSWNLDEYYGLAPTHDQSYRYFMDKNLFDHIDIVKKNTHVLNGLAKDWKKEVAFNEPGSSLTSRTRIVSLTPQTIKDNARFFKKAADVPKQALSMGVGSIMEAKRIVLLAFGANKAEAVKGAVEGGVSQFCTASALQMHQDCWFFCDAAAAAKLKLRKYYAWRAEEALKAEMGA